MRGFGSVGASGRIEACGRGAVRGTRRPRAGSTPIAPMPPATTAGDRPDERGEEAALGLAQLVRGRDEQGRDRADPAALVVGRVELDQRLADIDREHVRARRAERGRRARAPSSATGRRPIVAAPKTATAPSILTPTSCLSGRKAKKIATSVAPTRRRRAQMAEPGRRRHGGCRARRPAASRSRRRAAPRTDRARSRRARACSRGRSAARRPSGARDASSPRSACAASGRS